MGTFLLLSNSSANFGLHASEVVQLVFSAVVVIGLIGENKCRWPHPREDIFQALVIIGVAGELLGDGGMVVFTGCLQTISDAKVEAATIKAGNAQTSSDRAADASKRAMGSAQLANAQAGIAKQQADEIGKEADLLRRQTEKLMQENLAMEPRLEKAD